jgi:hypothetical protein
MLGPRPWFVSIIGVLGMVAAACHSTEGQPITPPGPPQAPAGGPCQPGVVETLSTGRLDGPLAVNDTHVFFVAEGGVLKRIRKDGSEAETLAEHLYPVRRMAADARFVYLTRGAASGPDRGSVVRVPVAGGAAQTLSPAEANPEWIGVRNGQVYWVAAGTQSVAPGTDYRTFDANAALRAIPADGASPVTLAGGKHRASGVGFHDAGVVWSGSGPGSYFVEQVARDGVSRALVNGMPSGAWGLVIDEAAIYGIVSEGGIRGRRLVDGVEWEVARHVPADTLLADGDSIFFLFGRRPATAPGQPEQAGTVGRVPKAGGAPVLYAQLARPADMAVDAACVYWTEYGADSAEVGVVRKTARRSP